MKLKPVKEFKIHSIINLAEDIRKLQDSRQELFKLMLKGQNLTTAQYELLGYCTERQ